MNMHSDFGAAPAPVPSHLETAEPKPKKRVLWKWSILVSVLVAGLLVWRCGSALMRTARMSDQAVGTFHSQLNSGSYETIFSEADSAFRGAAPRQELLAFLVAVHQKLGIAQHANLQTINVTTTTSGTFATTIYSTKFEKGDAIETFTWRVTGTRLILVGYNVQSRQLILN